MKVLQQKNELNECKKCKIFDDKVFIDTQKSMECEAELDKSVIFLLDKSGLGHK